MIKEIKKEIKLLRELRILSKKGIEKEEKIIPKFLLTLYSLLCFIMFYLLYLDKFFESDIGSTLLGIAIGLLSSLLLTVIAYPCVIFMNLVYKLKVTGNHSSSIIDKFKQLQTTLFISNKKAKKYIEKIDNLKPSTKEILGSYPINEMGNENLERLVYEKFVKSEIATKDLIINLSSYCKQIQESNLKNKNKCLDILLKRTLSSLDYETFNNYKEKIINVIDTYFNEYDQQNHLKEMMNIKNEFNNDIIKNNIKQYKMDLLNESIEIEKNNVLKSI